MVPGMAEVPQPIATLPESPAALGRHERGQRHNYRRIPLRQIHQWPINSMWRDSLSLPDMPANPKTVPRH